MYEVTIEIDNKKYMDSLIVSLVRQGYNTYLSYDKNICITVPEEDIKEIKHK